MVLVQKGAPHSLLLGTDLQARLGLSLSLESHGRRVDLLGAERDRPESKDQGIVAHPPPEKPVPVAADKTKGDGNQDCEGKNQTNKESSKENTGAGLPPVGVVRLLQNVRVPPGYKKIVRAKMEGEIEHSLLMCMPCGDNQVTCRSFL